MARRRSPANAVKRLFDSASCPVYVVDRSRQVVYCNPACAEWMGLDIDRLIGAQCDYGAPLATDSPVAGLSPPPEALLGERCEAAVSSSREGHPLRQRLAVFTPLGDCDASCVGCLAVVTGSDAGPSDLNQAPSMSESARLHHLVAAVRHEMGSRYSLDQVIGLSPAIRRVRSQIEVAIQTRSRVVVCGPPGSGREHVARTIHYQSEGAGETGGALVPLSCSLLDAELLQSTISEFIEQFPERIELKRPAALLLLDVDELASEAQAALMGALDIVELNLHTISTARRPLFELVANASFRADLAHSLSTLVIELPPLSERTEDIAVLAQAVLEDSNRGRQQQLSGLTTEAIDQLTHYPFHGNLDELRRMIELACQQATGPFVSAEDLPDKVERSGKVEAHPRRTDEPIELDVMLADIEKELIRRALARCKDNRAQAARLLGISRPRLLRRIEHFGL